MGCATAEPSMTLPFTHPKQATSPHPRPRKNLLPRGRRHERRPRQPPGLRRPVNLLQQRRIQRKISPHRPPRIQQHRHTHNHLTRVHAARKNSLQRRRRRKRKPLRRPMLRPLPRRRNRILHRRRRRGAPTMAPRQIRHPHPPNPIPAVKNPKILRHKTLLQIHPASRAMDRATPGDNSLCRGTITISCRSGCSNLSCLPPPTSRHPSAFNRTMIFGCWFQRPARQTPSYAKCCTISGSIQVVCANNCARFATPPDDSAAPVRLRIKPRRYLPPRRTGEHSSSTVARICISDPIQ